ncbi:SDR family oxidoreductase [Mycolicibacterium arenosum]|uniref:SDR family oxidoreductase n=1 Tax=Mycolicibacterium arenosum TaxID=2952157 RepID=A0ABT1M141_9MYCO|nr:SDR family oxidoreductase [Mycolicibacterium sp. CAU 1645]MCP9272512.1 SDR family oxidoreductase [Mycolicibacterium sp. CAU 1645]
MRIGARFVELDVTSDDSVSAAATAIEADGGLDVLINNAGIAERTPTGSYVPTPTRPPIRCDRPSRPTSSVWCASSAHSYRCWRSRASQPSSTSVAHFR